MALQQTDVIMRAYSTSCEVGNLTDKYVSNLMMGTCVKDLEKTLLILDVYTNLLNSYTVCGCGTDCTNNCITEEEVLIISDKISKLTGLCFEPIGYSYPNAISGSGIGAMQIGCDFIVS